MGDTKATRAGAYSSGPLRRSHLFPIVFRPIIRDEFTFEASMYTPLNSSSVNFR